MSDKLFYCSVILPKPCDSALEVQKNEETVYAEVKKTELASLESVVDPAVTGQQSISSAESPAKSEPRFQPSKKAVMCFAVLCTLLVGVIIALCVCNLQLRDSKATNGEIQALNENLTAEKQNLERTIGELKSQGDKYRMERNSLNETLMTILQFDNFPVKNYCSVTNTTTKERRCSPCQVGWKHYNCSCYYVYLGNPWKTWNESRRECIEMGADLVTIDSEDEQAFITQLAPDYYDMWHGYWIGLTRSLNGWFWVTDTPLTTGFWIAEPAKNYTSEECVLTNTNDSTMYNWRANPNCNMLNRWICEIKALTF